MRKIQIIAEIGLNWNGDIDTARRLIYLAKLNGADIAKFQLFDTDRIFPEDFEWYDLIKKCQWGKEDITEIKNYCDTIGIEFLASVFDVERVKWTEDIGMQRYKLASRSLVDLDLIHAIEKTDKDIIVSLGMFDVGLFPDINTKGNVDFLYCVSKYPTQYSDLSLKFIDYNRYSGFSDHTIGIECAMIAMARGARIIEKHFTLDKKMAGPDHICSMNPEELARLSDYRNIVEKVI